MKLIEMSFRRPVHGRGNASVRNMTAPHLLSFALQRVTGKVGLNQSESSPSNSAIYASVFTHNSARLPGVMACLHLRCSPELEAARCECLTDQAMMS